MLIPHLPKVNPNHLKDKEDILGEPSEEIVELDYIIIMEKEMEQELNWKH